MTARAPADRLPARGRRPSPHRQAERGTAPNPVAPARPTASRHVRMPRCAHGGITGASVARALVRRGPHHGSVANSSAAARSALQLAAWRHRVGVQPARELIELAVDALVAGLDGTALAELAGADSLDDQAVRDLFEVVLREQGLDWPSDEQVALWNLVRHTARQIVDGVLDPGAGAAWMCHVAYGCAEPGKANSAFSLDSPPNSKITQRRVSYLPVRLSRRQQSFSLEMNRGAGFASKLTLPNPCQCPVLGTRRPCARATYSSPKRWLPRSPPGAADGATCFAEAALRQSWRLRSSSTQAGSSPNVYRHALATVGTSSITQSRSGLPESGCARPDVARCDARRDAASTTRLLQARGGRQIRASVAALTAAVCCSGLAGRSVSGRCPGRVALIAAAHRWVRCGSFMGCVRAGHRGGGVAHEGSALLETALPVLARAGRLAGASLRGREDVHAQDGVGGGVGVR